MKMSLPIIKVRTYYSYMYIERTNNFYLFINVRNRMDLIFFFFDGGSGLYKLINLWQFSKVSNQLRIADLYISHPLLDLLLDMFLENGVR